MPSPPFRLVENEYTLLDLADLVFIDPVGTGFSRQGPDEQDGRFHGVTDDIESVGDFIRLYLTRFQRWTSPKFLIGESYGTTRAAGLSGYLQDRHGIYLNGIMLISSVLDHQTLRFSYGNDLPYILFLPSYAATAWYHGKAGLKDRSGLEDLLREAESFALGDYASALLKGTDLPAEEYERTAVKLSELTSLSPGFIRERNLRVSAWDFFPELLKSDRRKTGRLDARFSGFDVRQLSGDNGGFFSDPSYSVIQGAYTETLNDYISSQLNFRNDRVYEIISHRFRGWRQGPYEGRFINVTDTLGKAMAKNPYLKVFVASGYFDLATPYFATRYTFSHLYLPENLKRNISFAYYRAGHMMYIDILSLKQLRSDLERFILGDGARVFE
jgi:carboxypeptidase C (cathepsin A)